MPKIYEPIQFTPPPAQPTLADAAVDAYKLYGDIRNQRAERQQKEGLYQVQMSQIAREQSLIRATNQKLAEDKAQQDAELVIAGRLKENFTKATQEMMATKKPGESPTQADWDSVHLKSLNSTIPFAISNPIAFGKMVQARKTYEPEKPFTKVETDMSTGWTTTSTYHPETNVWEVQRHSPTSEGQQAIVNKDIRKNQRITSVSGKSTGVMPTFEPTTGRMTGVTPVLAPTVATSPGRGSGRDSGGSGGGISPKGPTIDILYGEEIAKIAAAKTPGSPITEEENIGAIRRSLQNFAVSPGRTVKELASVTVSMNRFKDPSHKLTRQYIKSTGQTIFTTQDAGGEIINTFTAPPTQEFLKAKAAEPPKGALTEGQRQSLINSKALQIQKNEQEINKNKIQVQKGVNAWTPTPPTVIRATRENNAKIEKQNEKLQNEIEGLKTPLKATTPAFSRVKRIHPKAPAVPSSYDQPVSAPASSVPTASPARPGALGPKASALLDRLKQIKQDLK